ncbi:MAG: hypothetical protein IJY27_02175 [Clostridia bacterium]|nr:hypothetical protein [Clostridia bacterium]
MQSSITPHSGISGVHRDVRLGRVLTRHRADKLAMISDLTYYCIVFGDVMPDLAALFDDIAKDEAAHFRLLGELIAALGQDPAINVRLRNEPLGLIDDKPCRAPAAAARVLNSLLERETTASRDFARLAAFAADNISAADILTRLATDDSLHARALRGAIRK